MLKAVLQNKSGTFQNTTVAFGAAVLFCKMSRLRLSCRSKAFVSDMLNAVQLQLYMHKKYFTVFPFFLAIFKNLRYNKISINNK